MSSKCILLASHCVIEVRIANTEKPRKCREIARSASASSGVAGGAVTNLHRCRRNQPFRNRVLGNKILVDGGPGLYGTFRDFDVLLVPKLV